MNNKDLINKTNSKVPPAGELKGALLREASSEAAAVCLSSAYLAPVDYYMALAQAERVLLENSDHYIKQTYRNRCRIAGANGTVDLTIPVEKTGAVKQLMRDVRISKHAGWQVQHWRSIESAYNSTPFFEYYKDDLLPFYEKEWTFLWDFNQSLQQKMVELLDINPLIESTGEYETDYGGEVLDLRGIIHPKKEPHHALKPYYQVFQQKFGFTPNLSIIDLLFNMGNEAVLMLAG